MPLEQMDFPTSYRAMRPVVEHEYFDDRAVPQLEDYISEQLQSNTYDFEANKALVKLYQFFPDLSKDEVISQIVAKALMNMPSTDMTALSYIVSEDSLGREPVRSLRRCAEALELAQFKTFWGITSEGTMPSFVKSIPGFKEQIRRYIVSALAATFQNVPKPYFEQCVDLSGPNLENFVSANPELMSLSGGKVNFALNEYNQVQPKKFKENVEFDKVLGTVAKLTVVAE